MAKFKDKLKLERFSFGVGDRFAHQAKAQLQAFQRLALDGVEVVPVWNKSNREHTLIGSDPQSVRDSAAAAVLALGWDKSWHVDADHIRLETVDRFLACSDFFTIDVAESIGKPISAEKVENFIERHPELVGAVVIYGIPHPFPLSEEDIAAIVGKYLLAVEEAGRIYRHILSKKGNAAKFITEVSMDETDSPQTPPELLVILAMLSDEGIRVQTIAPKFTGRFNKGVDYVGDLLQFEKEFNDDLAVIAHAVDRYDLPSNLKLSVHSGSDKFSLYPIIHRALASSEAGVHIKTAGTTWLEELIGLAESGKEGSEFVKEIYAQALAHVEDLCAPYAAVIDIDRSKLPTSHCFSKMNGTEIASAIRHVQQNPQFNANIRQLLHVAFKLAAKAGPRFTNLLVKNEEVVGHQVTENLYQRHLRPLFVG